MRPSDYAPDDGVRFGDQGARLATSGTPHTIGASERSPFRSPGRAELACVGHDPVRREINEGFGGLTEAMREERQVACIVRTEVMDKQVRRREDRHEEPEDKRRHEDGGDDEEDKDRQRRAYEKSDEHDGAHLEGAEPTNGYDGRQGGILLEPFGG